jgi:hypothetical protein
MGRQQHRRPRGQTPFIAVAGLKMERPRYQALVWLDAFLLTRDVCSDQGAVFLRGDYGDGLSAGARNPERSPTHFPKAWAIWPTSLAQLMSIAP